MGVEVGGGSDGEGLSKPLLVGMTVGADSFAAAEFASGKQPLAGSGRG